MSYLLDLINGDSLMQELSSPVYVPHRKIAFENIDGEVIMIDFEKGNYYSLHKSAAQIWNLIEKGASLEQILTAFSQAYSDSIESMQTIIVDFIKQLEAENLIVTTTTQPIYTDISISTQQYNHFEIPRLETYTDMSELLLLDPIHDVDEVKGWPNRQ